MKSLGVLYILIFIFTFLSCQDYDLEDDDVIRTEIPVVMINTPENEPIASKEQYIYGASMSVCDIGNVSEYRCDIKGRGNTTWDRPKKPYKIKFENKVSLLGEPKDKEWVLLANHFDKTMLRNDVAFWMASKYSKFDYVPRFHFVDLILNGKHVGLYQLGEQVKISKNRINVGDDGFLLEMDKKADASDVTFHVDHIVRPINIKEPKTVVGDEDYNYVKGFVSRADAALFSDDWLNDEFGYKTLMDMRSFAEWYVIMEITKNCDAAAFQTSCFMSLTRNGKLKMGPIWDFDVSLGGFPTEIWHNEFLNVPQNFYVKNDDSWIDRLFQDEAFVAAVKECFDNYYNHKSEIMAHIDQVARQNCNSAILNNKLWGVFYNKMGDVPSMETAYFEEVEYLKRWLSDRMDWMKSAFDAM